jgi:hypothetical protein
MSNSSASSGADSLDGYPLLINPETGEPLYSVPIPINNRTFIRFPSIDYQIPMDAVKDVIVAQRERLRLNREAYGAKTIEDAKSKLLEAAIVAIKVYDQADSAANAAERTAATLREAADRLKPSTAAAIRAAVGKETITVPTANNREKDVKAEDYEEAKPKGWCSGLWCSGRRGEESKKERGGARKTRKGGKGRKGHKNGKGGKRHTRR